MTLVEYEILISLNLITLFICIEKNSILDANYYVNKVKYFGYFNMLLRSNCKND